MTGQLLIGIGTAGPMVRTAHRIEIQMAQAAKSGWRKSTAPRKPSGGASSSPAAPKWRRRKDARPQEILKAALQIFAEKGFSAARVEDIAARAGVSKGTLYLYFDSKPDMLRALVQTGMIENLQSFAAMAELYPGSMTELLRSLLTAITQAIILSPLSAIPKIIIAESGNFPEMAKFYRREVIDRGLGLLSHIIARGVARGEFRAVNAEHTARLCMAPILLSAIWKNCFAQFDSTPFDTPAFVQTHLDVLLAGLRAATPTAPP